MSSMWCFQCGASYDASVPTCIECGVGLVEEPPLGLDEVGDPDDDHLAYDLHEWSFESRRMLDQLLTGRGIAHTWQGASMVVRENDEGLVDQMVDEVEHATLPTLDPDREVVVYEMAGWSAEHQTVLSNRLGLLGLAHEFDASGDLVVHAEDEDQVDSVLDEIEQGGFGEDGQGPVRDLDLDGLEVNDLLSALFGAADRLRRSAREAAAVREFRQRTAVLARVQIPFGFESRHWTALVARAEELSALLEAEDADDEEIQDRAATLRDALVQLI